MAASKTRTAIFKVLGAIALLFVTAITFVVIFGDGDGRKEEARNAGKIVETIRSGGSHYVDDFSGWHHDFIVKPIEVNDCKDYGAYRVTGFGQKNEKIDKFPTYDQIVCLPKNKR